MGTVTEGILNMPLEMAMADELIRRQFYQTVQAELSRLRVEVAGLRDRLVAERELRLNEARLKEQYRTEAKGLKKMLPINEKENSYVASESDERTANNTYRHQYRVLTEAEKAAMVAIKDKAAELEKLFRSVEASQPIREISLAVTNLEQAVMWGIKGLTK